MADNLIQLEQDVETFIDPNGVAGSILAQNHQDILKSVLNKVGKYVGSPYLATKNETNLQPGLMSWRGNVMNNTNQFQIDFAKLTADLNDFGLILETLAEGDLIHFKDSKGRSVFLEFVDFAPATNGGVDVYEVDVKGKAENINYVYQDNEKLISVLQSYKQNSAGAIYEIQFNAPNFVLLENGVSKTSIDLSIAITDTIQATETSLADFAINSANYTFQQGDVISIVTNPDNILELYLYKSGTKTDVNNYQKIDASKIDWSNVLNKPLNITSLEIRNENGIPQFTIDDFLNFNGFSFDIANKSILTKTPIFETFFIDTVNGSNVTGQKNDTSLPFASFDGALNYYKTNEPLVGNVSSKNYVFELVSPGTHSVSQKLIQSVNPNIPIGNKKATNIFIKSSVSANLFFLGNSTISCFLSNEGQTGNDSNNAFLNTLMIDIPFGSVTIEGESSLGSFNGNEIFDNQVNINVDTITHKGNKTICSFSKKGFGLIAKRMNIQSSAPTVLFFHVKDGKNIDIQEIVATSGFTFMRYFYDGCFFKFNKLTSNSTFNLTYGFGGKTEGIIYHGDVDYTGGLVGMFYLSTGGTSYGGSDLKLHFLRKTIIKGDVRITGNSSNANVTFSGEEVIYEDCTRLFNQLDYFNGKVQRIFFNIKRMFVFGEIGGSFINVGISMTNCFFELGGVFAKAPVLAKANLHQEDFDLVTVNGTCVIKSNLGSGNAITSDAQVNGTSVKVKINGDLLMLDGKIEETANLEVVKTVNLNRY